MVSAGSRIIPLLHKRPIDIEFYFAEGLNSIARLFADDSHTIDYLAIKSNAMTKMSGMGNQLENEISSPEV